MHSTQNVFYSLLPTPCRGPRRQVFVAGVAIPCLSIPYSLPGAPATGLRRWGGHYLPSYSLFPVPYSLLFSRLPKKPKILCKPNHPYTNALSSREHGAPNVFQFGGGKRRICPENCCSEKGGSSSLQAAEWLASIDQRL